MPGMAVLIFSFPEPGPGEDLTIPVLVEKVKRDFVGINDVKIHLGVKDAADEVIAIFDAPAQDEEDEGNLVRHARSELSYLEDDEEFKKSIIEAVRAFSSYGHSGGSASIAIPMLNDLLNFKNLTPLTDDPDEWIDHTDISGGEKIWQSTRNAEAFSNDGGHTYYLLSEGGNQNNPYPVHETKHFEKNSRGE